MVNNTRESRQRASALRRRVVSALVLAPPVLAAIWLGEAWFQVLLVVVALLMAWEWDRLCGSGHFDASGMAILGVLAMAALGAAAGRYDWALAAAVMGAVCVAAVAAGLRRGNPLLTAAGVLYIALPCLALAWLRDRPTGRGLVVWLFLVVWATDIGAFAAGRAFGGPLLAPRISPKKTWAGLAGGIVSAMAVSALTAYSLQQSAPLALILGGGLLALVEQGGDLLESAVKRHLAVKDSGTLIPGHGGLFDRLDGLLLAAPVVAIVDLLGKNSVLIGK